MNSMRNLISGFVSRIMLMLLGLVVRTVFIKTLGNDYLSVNGLYSNILSMLSLAELGFGTAMVYSMYKPLSEKNEAKLASLMQLYSKVYRTIGFVILVLGLCLVPFLKYIIKNPPEVPYLTVYYIMFLLNTVFSYWLFSYKRSILTADQKEYVCTNYRNILSVIRSVIQIVLLIISHNYFIYLLIQMITTIAENIVVGRRADKLYPALKIKNPQKLSQKEIGWIKHDVKGLMLSKLSHVILNSTDNIIISAFVGVSWVGLLSNFNMIVDSVTGVLCQVTSALSASLGNYFVEHSKEDSYALFERVEFMNSWLYGFSSIALVTLLNPFVTLWIGEEYTLSTPIVLAITLNFFVAGYMNTLWTFRSTLGLFTQGWYRPLIVSGLNIILSIAMGIKLGIFGVLFATFISRACVNLWFDPLIIYKYGFERSVKLFYLMYICRIVEILSILAVISGIKYVIMYNGINIFNFIIMMLICVIVTIGMFWIFSHKRDEYKYFKDVLYERFLRVFLEKVKK